MRKYISIFELFARNTIYKVFFVLLSMGVTQMFAFYKTMTKWILMDFQYYERNVQAIEHYSLEWMIDKSNSVVFLGVAFVLITAILCWNGCDLGSKSSYTIQRLQVTEKTFFIMQCIYNSVCYVILLGVQIWIFWMQCALYMKQAGTVTNQTVFLAFYRNDYMHSILPLEGGMRWMANIFIVLGCSVAAAVFAYLQRRGKLAWSLLVVVACVLLGFVKELGNGVIGLTAMLVSVTAGGTAYRHVFAKKDRIQ